MPTLNDVKQVFLDMDGTIYNGDMLFPATVPFLEFLKSRRIGRTFLTNNSSYGADEYAARLNAMGVSCDESDFYTSTDYLIDYLRRAMPEAKRLFLLGMPCMALALERAGFELDDLNPQLVVVSFDRKLVYENLCRAAYFLSMGVPGVATHPDPFCPTDQPMTRLLDCGAVTACLERGVNVKIKVLGKPDPGMLFAAARRCGVAPRQCLMIGDRLSTDIALGVNAGAMTCHIRNSGADLTPTPGVAPDLAVNDLGGLQKLWEEC